ncbi:MAG: bestrophin family protein [Cytophagales bacterium]
MFENFWFKAVPSFFTTKVLRTLAFSCLIVAVYTFAILYFEQNVLHIDFKPSPTIFSLLGVVLGLLLVFRTNTAYDRWWEGRRMLGNLTNNTRSFAIKLDAYLAKDDLENRLFFAQMIGNYGVAMKEHLRKGVKFKELEIEDSYLEELKKTQHVPNKIAAFICRRVTELYRKGLITKEEFIVIDKNIESFTDVVGACERIKNTPIPKSYSIHLKKFLFLYMMMLPFGIIHDLQYWSILVMVIVFYAFTGLEIIGEEIEDPFGKDINDLQTDAISKNIRANVHELLGV